MLLMFGIAKDDADRLKRLVQSYEGGRLSPAYQGSPRPTPGPVETWVALTTSTITALSGTTPGSGTAELYSLSSGSLVDQSISLTVYNLGASITSSKFITLQRDPISGSFFVDDDDCCGSSSSSSTTLISTCCTGGGGVPGTLHATITNVSACSCLAGTYVLTNVGGSNWFSACINVLCSCNSTGHSFPFCNNIQLQCCNNLCADSTSVSAGSFCWCLLVNLAPSGSSCGGTGFVLADTATGACGSSPVITFSSVAIGNAFCPGGCGCSGTISVVVTA